MRTRTTGFALALCFISAAVCFASSQLGTWKLNEEKSKLAPAAARNHTVVYEAVGDDVKITVDGTDPAGTPTHNEWTGRFDGKDYPVVGDPHSDARSYTVVDANTLDMTIKKDGAVTITGQIAVSADGKTRSVTLNGTDAQGQKFTSTVVYDRQ